MGRWKQPVAERFWAKVNKDGPVPEHMPKLGSCWLWTKGVDREGYGLCGSGRAHRVAWTLAHGKPPNGLCVCHACDNAACVNPAHLWLGTHTLNNLDMRSKGRASPLFTHGSPLVDVPKDKIASMVSKGATVRTIVKTLGLKHTTVWRTIKRLGLKLKKAA